MATFTVPRGDRITYIENSATVNTYVINDDTRGAIIGGAVNGDIVAVEGFASEFKARFKGGVLYLRSTLDPDLKIRIKMEKTDGSTVKIQFLDGELVAEYDKPTNSIKLGSQALTQKGQRVDSTNLGPNDSQEIFAQSGSGQTFTLTTTLDSVPGLIGSKGTTDNDGDDTIIGLATIAAVGADTLSLGDQIDGGNGDDTLKIFSDGADIDLGKSDISGIEHFTAEVVASEIYEINLANNEFSSVLLDFNGSEIANEIDVDNVNQSVSDLTILGLDNDDSDLDIHYSSDDQAINNAISVRNSDNIDLEVYIENPEDEDGRLLPGGSFTLVLDNTDDIEVEFEDVNPTDLTVQVDGDSDNFELEADENFKVGESQTVNFILNADLQSDNIDLADNDQAYDTDEATEVTVNITGEGNLTVNGDGFDTEDGWGNDDVESTTALTINGSTATGNIDIQFFEEYSSDYFATNVVSVTTGSGDDRVGFNKAYFDGSFDDDGQDDANDAINVNLGSGRNTLAVNGNYWFSDDEMDDLDFTKATISGVQILELDSFVDGASLGQDATINMEGLDAVDTLLFSGDFYANDYTLSLRFDSDDAATLAVDESLDNAPESFTVTANGEIDNLVIDSGKIANLTITAGEGEDVDVEGVESEFTESLSINGDTAWVDLYGDEDNLKALTTLNVNAATYASVEIEGPAASSGTGGDFENYEITITNGFTGGGNLRSWTGVITFADGTRINISDEKVGGNGSIAKNPNAIATKIAQVLRELGYNNVVDSGDTVTFESRTATNASDLATITFDGVFSNGSGVDATGTATTTDPGADPTSGGVSGGGFAALADTNVVAGEDAYVNMDNISGTFDLNVTAGTAFDTDTSPFGEATVELDITGVSNILVNAATDANVDVDVAPELVSVTVNAGTADSSSDADVDLVDTGVQTVSVTAADWVDVYIESAANLTNVTLAAGDDDSDNYLELIDTTDLSTIDLTGIVDGDTAVGNTDAAYIYVDASAANFQDAVTIRIGESDLEYIADLANSESEIFSFVGSNIGNVEITNFEGGGAANLDKLDLSAIAGINSLASDIDIDAVVDGLLITSAAFEGSILLVGYSL